ncbi:MAG TPA: energy transducer TonB [Candidatus Cybelea sp.]|nr:energy transducer TonB [Candidatus Cybelea sp.]
MKQLSLGVAFILALCAGAPARPPATTQPAQPSSAAADTSLWLDPFCALYVTAQPIDTSPPSEPVSPISNLLAMGVFAEAGARADVHVTLLSDTGAYDAFLQDVPLLDDGKGLRSHNILVQLPKAMHVRFVYVDSFAVDGGTKASCPSEPFDLSPVKTLRVPPPPAAVQRVSAVFKQSLPALPCGKIFSNATILKAVQPVYPLLYFDHDRSVQIEIFVDSNGNAVKTSVYKSSGLQAFDSAATEAALRSKYAPPMLLCTPVVGKYLFRADFAR